MNEMREKMSGWMEKTSLLTFSYNPIEDWKMIMHNFLVNLHDVDYIPAASIGSVGYPYNTPFTTWGTCNTPPPLLYPNILRVRDHQLYSKLSINQTKNKAILI